MLFSETTFEFATEAAQYGSPAAEAADTMSTAGDGLLSVNAGSPSLWGNLQVAVREGRSLLVEDIGTSIDPVLDPVLCHRTFMKVWLPRRCLLTKERNRSTTCHRQPSAVLRI